MACGPARADDVFPASPQHLVEWTGGELARIGVR